MLSGHNSTFFFGESLTDAVQDNGGEHDGDAAGEPSPDLNTGDAVEHLCSQCLGAYHGGDNDHRQGHHDSLV